MERDGAGNLSTLYTYGNQRINSESINNISGIYTYDGRGSVSSVIGGFGDYRATYWYDGLGNVIRNLYGAGDSNNRYKPYYGYNAEQYNPVTGNQNLRARQLNIRRQRFLTEDTYLGNKTDVLSINRYLYANDNPLRYTDPSGNASLPSDVQQEIYNMYSEYTVNYFKGIKDTAINSFDDVTNSILAGINTSITVISEIIKLNPTKVMINGAVAGMAALPRTNINNNDSIYKRGSYRDGLPDYTIAINEMLEREERNYKMVAILADATRAFDWKGTTAEAIKYSYFYQQEKSGGRLDIKLPDKWKDAFDNEIQYLEYGEKNNSRYGDFIYEDMVINAAELGNIAYGYWGKALGFADETLYYGGGFARLRSDGLFDDNIYNRLITDQYYGDKPEDIFDIERGINLYNKKHFTGCFGGK